MKRDSIPIRTESRETYLFTSGAISKVDMIRARRQILIERVFTRPDGVSDLKTEILQYPTEREWIDARYAILRATGLMAYLEDSTQSTHMGEPAPSRRAEDRQSTRARNLWAALRARLNIRRRDE